MTWDEPTVLVARLEAHCGPGSVLRLPAGELADVPAAQLDAARAVVVVGDGLGEGTSRDLQALAVAIERRGGTVALRTFVHRTAGAGARTSQPLVVGLWHDDPSVTELLAAGPHGLLLDSAIAGADHTGPGARVCVVSFELAGMTGGGIGTAETALALSLARSGHDVTLLFTGWEERDTDVDHERWRAHYAARGVTVELLREPGRLTVRTPFYTTAASYEVYRWLVRAEPFDVVHVPENLGHGAYAQLAKRQGSAFATTTFVVGTHGPTRWAAEANRHAITDGELPVRDAFERLSVALADVLLGPSVYLHDYLRARGWTLPSRVHVQPYALPDAVRDAEPPTPDDALPRELVFFGRLETRKGVAALCDALDLLAARPPAGIEDLTITFLGPPASVLGEPALDYVARRGAAWPWPWTHVGGLNQEQAAAYLRRPGVLAVMPSLVDNAPNTVSEAVALGIPLIASRAGGTGELVAADERDEYTYDNGTDRRLLPLGVDVPPPTPDAGALAALIVRRLTEPASRPVRAPAAAGAVDRSYDRWHRAARAAAAATGTAAGPAADPRPWPSLAVCVLDEGDGDALDAVLEALAPQVAALAAELVVADPAIAGGVGAARDAAVATTTADLVVMLRTRELPLDGMLEGFARAAAATDANVLSCAVLDDEPLIEGAATAADPGLQAFVPVFGPPQAGLDHPAFAVGPYAIRRETLDRIGGYAPDALHDEADHELLNRATLAGEAVEVIPVALARARATDRWTALRTTWPHHTVVPPYDAEQFLCVERPFRTTMTGPGDLIGLLRGVREEAARRVSRAERILGEERTAAERIATEYRAWIDALEATSAQLRADREALLAEGEALRAQLRTLRESPSWKVTRPLRAVQRRRPPE